MINIQKNGELQNYEGEDDDDLDAVMMKMTIWFCIGNLTAMMTKSVEWWRWQTDCYQGVWGVNSQYQDLGKCHFEWTGQVVSKFNDIIGNGDGHIDVKGVCGGEVGGQ